MQLDPQMVQWGAAAQRKGYPRTSCPYASDGPARTAWLAGWDEARARASAPYPVALTADVTAALDAADRVMRMLVPDAARLTPQQKGIKAAAEQAFADARDAVDVIEATAAVHAATMRDAVSGGGERADAAAGSGPERGQVIAAGGAAAAEGPGGPDATPATAPVRQRALDWPWRNRPRVIVVRPARGMR